MDRVSRHRAKVQGSVLLNLHANEDIQSLTGQSRGLPPNETGTPYTIPTIRLGDRYVTDSKNIARELEALHPSPPLYLDDLTLAEAEAIQNELLASFRYVTLPKVAARLLPERDFEYFVRTREAAFGTTLPKLEEEKGEEAWTNSEPAIQKWAELLKRNGGPFVKGKTGMFSRWICGSELCYIAH